MLQEQPSSSLCERRTWLSWAAWDAKDLPQYLHLKGFSPECCLICVRSILEAVNLCRGQKAGEKVNFHQLDNQWDKGVKFTVTDPYVTPWFSIQRTLGFNAIGHARSTGVALIKKDTMDMSLVRTVALQWLRSPGGLVKNADWPDEYTRWGNKETAFKQVVLGSHSKMNWITEGVANTGQCLCINGYLIGFFLLLFFLT